MGRLHVATWVLLGCACALPFMGQVDADADLWWHVRTGQRILAEGAIPAVDDWSFTANGRPWMNHEWLADVIFGAAYNAWGAAGLAVVRGLLLATLVAGLVLIGARRAREPLLVALVLLFTMPVLGVFINVRAHSFTYTLTVWVIVLLDAARAGRTRWLWCLPPIMALWVNLHGGFLLGLALIGTSLGAMLLGLDGLPARPRGRDAGIVVAVGLATLAAPLLNPWGSSLFGYLASELGANHSIITEWQPVQGAQLLFFFAYLLVPLALWALSRRWLYLTLPFMLLLTASSTWTHARFFVLVGLFGAVVAMGALGELSRRLREGQPLELIDRLLHPALTAGAMALLLMGTVAQLGHHALAGRPMLTVNTELYPVQAVRWLGTQQLGTRVAQPLHWGGYVLWHRPELLVALDGRNLTVYDDVWVDTYLRGMQDGVVHELLDLSAVDLWLLPEGPQSRALEAEGWHAVYVDPVARVLSRSNTKTVVGPAAPESLLFP